MGTPAPPVDLAAVLETLAELGATSASLPAFRSRALEVLNGVAPFDAAIFHALSPRVPLETAAIRGIDMPAVAKSRFRWDDFAIELAPLRDLANRSGVASDEQAFPSGTRARARFERQLGAVYPARSACVVHLVVRGAYQSALVLLARRRAAFGARSLTLLQALRPTLSVADALQARLDGVRRSTAQLRLVCRDERLTTRQRQIVEHVALGHTNADIAVALGLSVHTLRNHLVRIFTRIGASNRADLVRLAVLGPFD